MVAKGLITKVDPAERPPAGGTPVPITGSDLTQGMTVKFGDELATNVNVVDQTTVTATMPMQPKPGSVDVRVDAGADLVGVSPGAFKYK